MNHRKAFQFIISLFVTTATFSQASFAQGVNGPLTTTQRQQLLEEIDQQIAGAKYEQTVTSQEINIIRSYLNSKNFDWTIFYYHRLNNAKTTGATLLAAGVATHMVNHFALWQRYFKMADKKAARAVLLRTHAMHIDDIGGPVMRIGLMVLVGSAMAEMALENVNGTNKAALVKSLDRLSPEDRIRLLDLKIETFYLNTDTVLHLVENKKNLDVAPSAMAKNVVDRTQ